jgi:hypothetical protein
LCHDPLFDAGLLGNRCYDELDHETRDSYKPDDNDEYRPINDRCTEQEVKDNKYRPEIGSPCDPVSFCEDRNTNDQTKIDYCEDSWGDKDTENNFSEDDPCGPQGQKCEIKESEQEENETNNNDSFLGSETYFD